MKLINRTYLFAAIGLLPVLLLGGMFSYYTIQYINYEEADEFLNYEMERLLRYHHEHFDLPEYHKVADILPDQYYAEPVFKDTLLLESGDNEMVPYRELRFSIEHKGKNFGIVLRHLMPGRDDIAEGALMIVSGMTVLVALVLWLVVHQVNRVLWKPFYVTLLRLQKFRIGDRIPDFPETSVDEFQSLNNTIRLWLQRVSQDYQSNKTFNENASHELQTHLAVIRSNTEKLLNDWSGGEQQLKELSLIYDASTKLNRYHKSLLLLSKISNEEYHHPTELNLRKLLVQNLEQYREVLELRQIRISTHLEDCHLKMDVGLAEILVNNLLKNAVKHNLENGFIQIELTQKQLTIENSGNPLSEAPEKMIERFSRGKSGNLGVGLAIVRQICEQNHFKLEYTLREKSVHSVTVTFSA